MIKNKGMKAYAFLEMMFRDDYFPNDLVEKGAQLLRDLCVQLEGLQQPQDAEVYALTNAMTEAFNQLDEELQARGSEIETAARDCIAMDVDAILDAYDLGHLDLEEALAERDW